MAFVGYPVGYAYQYSLIVENMGAWVYALTNEDQLRWVGPEKGVIALAVAAIVNAFWDGYAFICLNI